MINNASSWASQEAGKSFCQIIKLSQNSTLCERAQGTVSEAEMLNIFLGTIIVPFNTARKEITKFSARVTRHDGEERNPEKSILSNGEFPLWLIGLSHCSTAVYSRRSTGFTINACPCSFTNHPGWCRRVRQTFVFQTIPPPLLNPKVNPVELA